MKKIYYIISIVVLISSCAKVTYSPEAESASRNHRIIAVLMPKVNLPVDKKVTADDKLKMEISEAEQFHSEVINWLQRRKAQNKINVDILDAPTTTAKLANLSKDKVFTPNEYAEALDVDAVITSNWRLTKPMSTGAAIATTLLFGFGSTNEANVTMDLHDRKMNKVIMTFSHRVTGGLLNSRDDLTNEIMRLASKKLPYTKFEIK
jgi:hypothetical protein